jgi:hypothetical protein
MKTYQNKFNMGQYMFYHDPKPDDPVMGYKGRITMGAGYIFLPKDKIYAIVWPDGQMINMWGMYFYGRFN